jgi:hypothetical protein
VDLERSSKNCSICSGALSIKHSDPAKYSQIKNKHKCEKNHSGSSGMIPFRRFYFNYVFLGSMEAQGIYRLFARSERIYNVQYIR